jgi:hypothetical protein
MQTQHIARDEIGLEEWKPLDVIPMEVGNQHVGGNRQFLQKGLRQWEYASARVNNDQLIVDSSNLNAGGVAAITHCRGSWRRD